MYIGKTSIDRQQNLLFIFIRYDYKFFPSSIWLFRSPRENKLVRFNPIPTSTHKQEHFFTHEV